MDSHSLDLTKAKLAKAMLDTQGVPTSSKSIRLKCLDCCSGAYAEVKNCQVFDCPLWQCRLGKRPSTAKRKTPQLLDPVFVAMAAHKQGMRENDDAILVWGFGGTARQVCGIC